MEEAGCDAQRTTQKKSDLEELWASSTVKKLRNPGKLRYRAAVHSLHNRRQEDYDAKRTRYRELKADLIPDHKLNINRDGPWTMDKQFTPSLNASIVLNQWTAEEE